jgi:hypothetical protein
LLVIFLKEKTMKNLEKALEKVLSTVETVAKAYEDKKIVPMEWIKIGRSAVMWTWIFKHLPEIKADMDTATEAGVTEMIERLKVKFDIPQDKLEEAIEQALSVVLIFLVMVWGEDGLKKDETQVS